MIFGASETIPKALTLFLTCAILVLVAKVVRLLQLTRVQVRVTAQVSIFCRSVRVHWAELTTDNGRLDLDIMNTESEIIGVQDPDVRNIMRWVVRSFRGGSDVNRRIGAVVCGNKLAFMQIRRRILRTQLGLNGRFALSDQ